MSVSKPEIVCPTCKRRFEADVKSPTMPFCSHRCKLADLHRWMMEDIGIPSGSSEPEDEDEEPPPATTPREWKFE